jgi:hypothetical protein
MRSSDQPEPVDRRGRCSVRLAEALAKRTGLPVGKAYEVVEDLARELPEHIVIKDPQR